MTDTAKLLADLARAKVLFQRRAIEAVICAQPHQAKPAAKEADHD